MGGINTCTFIPYRKLCSFPDPRVYTDIQGASGQNPFLLILCEKGDNFLCTTFVITQMNYLLIFSTKMITDLISVLQNICFLQFACRLDSTNKILCEKKLDVTYKIY